jgi:tetratricopeptide (TPR) repeat protein
MSSALSEPRAVSFIGNCDSNTRLQAAVCPSRLSSSGTARTASSSADKGSHDFSTPIGSALSTIIAMAGKEPGRWPAGLYRVDVYVAGTKVASGSFEIAEAVPAEIYISRGLDYYRKGQLNEAIAEYSKAIELNPRAAAAYNNRRLAYADQEQYDQALADWTRAIELNQRYATAYLNRGVIYYKTAQFDQALADFRKALEINPKDATTAKNLEHTSKAKSEITEPWQASWEAFAKEVQRLYNSRAAESEFIKRFNGKQVFWEGDVLEVHLDKDPKEVTLRMPQYRITLPDGRVALMELALLTVKGGFTYHMFQKNRFQARLSTGDEDFPAAVSSLHSKNEATCMRLQRKARVVESNAHAKRTALRRGMLRRL